MKYAFMLLLLLSACVPAAKIPGQPENHTTYLAPTSISIPTRESTPLSSATPDLQSTSLLSSTRDLESTLSITWSKEIVKPVVIEDFEGMWSPTANKIAGIQSKGIFQTGSLVLAQSPDFAPSLLDRLHPDNVWANTIWSSGGINWSDLIWSPDGKYVLYGVPNEPGTKNDNPLDISADIWMADSGSGNIKPTRFGSMSALAFWGWMDDQTVVNTGLSGGGHVLITEWNYGTGKILAADNLPVYALGSLTNLYAPVSGCERECTTYVLVRNPVKPYNQVCGEACQSKEFPRDQKTFTERVDVFYQDWLSGGKKLLVAAHGPDDKVAEGARLILWDVATNQLTSVAAGGIYGRYYDNGKILAWVTYGPASQYPADVSGPAALDPINSNDQTYIQLMNTETHQVIMSLPVYTYSWLEFDIDGFIDPVMTISPDNRWMTLLSPGQIRLSDQNGTIEAVTKSDQGWSFNIINLQTRQLIKSVEIDNKFNFQNFRPVWSPLSDQFVFQDETGNWHLFKANTVSLTPVTEKNGALIGRPSWSFDGRYLQFIYNTSDPNCFGASCSKGTYIFDFSKDN
jgi:hypothetical protein